MLPGLAGFEDSLEGVGVEVCVVGQGWGEKCKEALPVGFGSDLGKSSVVVRPVGVDVNAVGERGSRALSVMLAKDGGVDDTSDAAIAVWERVYRFELVMRQGYLDIERVIVAGWALEPGEEVGHERVDPVWWRHAVDDAGSADDEDWAGAVDASRVSDVFGIFFEQFSVCAEDGYVVGWALGQILDCVDAGGALKGRQPWFGGEVRLDEQLVRSDVDRFD